MNEAIKVTIGVDIGDRQSEICVLEGEGQDERIDRVKISTTRKAFELFFKSRPPARVVMETGTHSGWISSLLRALGHEVVVANSRQLALITQSKKKSDRRDAELLARLGRSDLKLLSPVTHRSAKAQAQLSLVRARDALVHARTLCVNSARGLVKAAGARLAKCSPAALPKHREEVPVELRGAIAPIFASIRKLTEQIKVLEKRVAAVESERPEVKRMRQIDCVGLVTATAFALTIDDPARFKKSRSVGAFVGLPPAQSQSGDSDPQLGITKTGDELLRRLLVNCANRMLGPFGKDSDLRRWGLQLAARGGKRGKAIAKVAVARKLAVLMHRLWVTGEEYVPLGYGKKQEKQEAAA